MTDIAYNQGILPTCVHAFTYLSQLQPLMKLEPGPVFLDVVLGRNSRGGWEQAPLRFDLNTKHRVRLIALGSAWRTSVCAAVLLVHIRNCRKSRW